MTLLSSLSRAVSLIFTPTDSAEEPKLLSMSIEPGNKELVAKTLAHWKQDTDLAGIRDEKELGKLPESERKEWQSLWAEVEALLRRARGPKP